MTLGVREQTNKQTNQQLGPATLGRLKQPPRVAGNQAQGPGCQQAQLSAKGLGRPSAAISFSCPSVSARRPVTDPLRPYLLSVSRNPDDSLMAPPPLISAAQDGSVENVRTQLLGGDDANLTDGEGSTALIWASAFGHEEVVRVLLEVPNTQVSVVCIRTYSHVYTCLRACLSRSMR